MAKLFFVVELDVDSDQPHPMSQCWTDAKLTFFGDSFALKNSVYDGGVEEPCNVFLRSHRIPAYDVRDLIGRVQSRLQRSLAKLFDEMRRGK